MPLLSDFNVGGIVPRDTRLGYADSSLVLIHALIHMILYCIMGSDPNGLIYAMQWTSITVILARQTELNRELDDVEEESGFEKDTERWEYLESRRRTW